MPVARCSVLLPVRNAINTLDDCIASISTQSISNFEVVAVDDGSTDGSLERLRDQARRDPRWRVVSTPPLGVVAALNTGLGHCTNERIARMDADDVMLPERLERQCAMLDHNPDIAVVGSRVELMETDVTADGFREYLRWQNACVTPQRIALSRYIESPLVHPSVMFRRKIVLRHGGYRDGQFAEDYELWLRLLERGESIGKCPETLLRWRDTPTRLSRNDPRCSDGAFSRLRLDYLARDRALAEARSRLLIWGAGRKTRLRLAPLFARGFTPQAWIDIDPRKIGNVVDGAPVLAPCALSEFDDPFILSCVRNHGAREQIADALRGLNLVEGQHWLSVG